MKNFVKHLIALNSRIETHVVLDAFSTSDRITASEVESAHIWVADSTPAATSYIENHTVNHMGLLQQRLSIAKLPAFYISQSDMPEFGIGTTLSSTNSTTENEQMRACSLCEALAQEIDNDDVWYNSYRVFMRATNPNQMKLCPAGSEFYISPKAVKEILEANRSLSITGTESYVPMWLFTEERNRAIQFEEYKTYLLVVLKHLRTSSEEEYKLFETLSAKQFVSTFLAALERVALMALFNTTWDLDVNNTCVLVSSYQAQDTYSGSDVVRMFDCESGTGDAEPFAYFLGTSGSWQQGESDVVSKFYRPSHRRERKVKWEVSNAPLHIEEFFELAYLVKSTAFIAASKLTYNAFIQAK